MAIRSVAPTVSSSQFDTAIAEFKELVAIPSVTDNDDKQLEAAAEFCSKNLQSLGGFEVRLVRIENSAPFVVAKRILLREYPTIFLYSHYDTPSAKGNPYVLTERDGRLYGPGACGKGGIITILTALGMTLSSSKALPLNMIVIFSGENGKSPNHLSLLLMREMGEPISKAAVLFEGSNINAETGSLLYCTRGNLRFKLTVAVANKPVPSDDTALLPDLTMHFSKWVSSLDPPSSIPHFLDNRFHPNKQELEQLKMCSPTFQEYTKKVGMLPGVKDRSNNHSVYTTIATEPWIQVLKMRTGESSGKMAPSFARATVEIRTLSIQSPEDIEKVVKNHLEQMPNPHIFQRVITTKVRGKGWQCYLDNPFPMAYQNALHSQFPRGWHHPASQPDFLHASF